MSLYFIKTSIVVSATLVKVQKKVYYNRNVLMLTFFYNKFISFESLRFSCFLHRHIYHHHHVMPLARISLTLSRHSSLSFIAPGRFSNICLCLPPDRTWHKVMTRRSIIEGLGEGKVGHEPRLEPCWSLLVIGLLSAMWACWV